jgi:hypothetical protein
MSENLRRGSSGQLAADLRDRTFAALWRRGSRNVELTLLGLGSRRVRRCRWWRHRLARRRERVDGLKAAVGVLEGE